MILIIACLSKIDVPNNEHQENLETKSTIERIDIQEKIKLYEIEPKEAEVQDRHNRKQSSTLRDSFGGFVQELETISIEDREEHWISIVQAWSQTLKKTEVYPTSEGMLEILKEEPSPYRSIRITKKHHGASFVIGHKILGLRKMKHKAEFQLNNGDILLVYNDHEIRTKRDIQSMFKKMQEDTIELILVRRNYPRRFLFHPPLRNTK